MYELKKEISGVVFDVNFSDKICVLKGASGTGKTFLFKTIVSDCYFNNISCIYIDYHSVTSGNEHLIPSQCEGKEVIILDNADLYLTGELFNKIKTLGSTLIMSKKSTFGLDMSEGKLYRVEFDGYSLRTRRLG